MSTRRQLSRRSHVVCDYPTRSTGGGGRQSAVNGSALNAQECGCGTPRRGGSWRAADEVSALTAAHTPGVTIYVVSRPGRGDSRDVRQHLTDEPVVVCRYRGRQRGRGRLCESHCDGFWRCRLRSIGAMYTVLARHQWSLRRRPGNGWPRLSSAANGYETVITSSAVRGGELASRDGRGSWRRMWRG